jgi:hypothetical protein
MLFKANVRSFNGNPNFFKPLSNRSPSFFQRFPLERMGLCVTPKGPALGKNRRDEPIPLDGSPENLAVSDR